MSVQPCQRAKARIATARRGEARVVEQNRVEEVKARVSALLTAADTAWAEEKSDIRDAVKVACVEASQRKVFYKWEEIDGGSGGIRVILVSTLVAPVASDLFASLEKTGYLDFVKPENSFGIELRIWVETVKGIKTLIIQKSKGRRLYEWNEDWFAPESDNFVVQTAEQVAA